MARVLIVDDERLIQQLLSRLVNGEGHTSTLAGSVPEARSHLEQEEFDLVLCDVDMPGESGFELVRFLRNRGGKAAVVMMSGIEDARLAAAAVDLGVDGYMLKPFQLDEARAKVADALARRARE
jgi:putative two-component system response regulator